MKFITLSKFAGLLVVVFVAATNLAFAQRQFKVLLYTKTEGFHHESIKEGVDAIRKMAERHNFTVEWQENASVFNDKKMEEFKAVIFLNTTGNILNDEQQKAMEKFIKAGNGFVGIHSAADTEYDWEWYTKLVGRMFKTHPPTQTATLKLSSAKFPGMERVPASWQWTDEWYEYGEDKIKGLNTLLAVDEKTYEAKTKFGPGMGDFHPIAWYHDYDGGRAFYTGLGHVPLVYSDPIFLEHLFGGIFWAATGKGIPK
jgi:uncharacterized protein